MEAIKIALLHFEGEAHNWWFYGLSTLGHANVTAYSEFTRDWWRGLTERI